MKNSCLLALCALSHVATAAAATSDSAATPQTMTPTAVPVSHHPVKVDPAHGEGRVSGHRMLSPANVEAPVFAMQVRYDEQGRPIMACDVIHDEPHGFDGGDEEQQR